MASEEECLPSDVRQEMLKVERSLEAFEDLLKKLTEKPLLDTKKKLSAVERAKLDLTTTYAINSLFWIYLVTQGVNTTDHQVKDELNRVKAYMSKIKSTEDKAEVSRLKVDKDAAKRFVKSALWTEPEKVEPEKKEHIPPSDLNGRKNVSKRKREQEGKKKKKKKKMKQD